MAATIAYLILSHDNPRQVARLARRLRDADPDCLVVVHHDSARTTLDGEGLEDEPRIDVLSFVRGIEWGGWGMVEAMLRSLEWMRLQRPFDWVVTLSGQDYPVSHPRATRERLVDGEADAHLTLYHELSPRPEGPERDRWWSARYFYAWRRLPAPPARLRLPAAVRAKRIGLQKRLSLAQRRVFVWSLLGTGGTFVGVRRHEPFGPGFRVWGGSQWFAASSRAVDAIFAFIRDNPRAHAHFRRTMIPDEAFFNSVLMNAPGLRIAQPNLGHWKIDETGNRGVTFRAEDAGELLATGAAFARKIDDRVDGALLDELDRRLGLGG